MLSNSKYPSPHSKKSVIEAWLWHTVFERKSSSLYMFEKSESFWINLNLFQSNAWRPRENKLKRCDPRSLPAPPPPPSFRFVLFRNSTQCAKLRCEPASITSHSMESIKGATLAFFHFPIIKTNSQTVSFSNCVIVTAWNGTFYSMPRNQRIWFLAKAQNRHFLCPSETPQFLGSIAGSI